ncbi:MAG: DUF4912 domain-containing protein, partial [Calothrix sp. C42_A2020_038]|nr:DUF4912 domain-containing protein [Calothrix sp. C42_A2020_038]
VDVDEVAQPTLVEPTITVDVDEVAQPTLVEPTITVDVDEVAQPTLVEPTITVDVNEVAQPTFVEPTITVDVDEVAQPTLLETSTTEQIDAEIPQSDSWLGNVAASAAIAGGAAAVVTDWLSSSSTEEQNSESNNENLENSNITVDTSNDTEVHEAELLDITEVVDTNLSGNDTGASGVILTHDTDTQLEIPRDNTEVSQTDTTATQFDAVVDTVESRTDVLEANIEPSSIPDNISPVALAGGAVLIANTYNHGQKTDIISSDIPPENIDANLVATSEATSVVETLAESTASQISLTARTPKWAYVAWHIDAKDKQQAGTSQLALRLYDVTDTDLSYQTPQLVQQYECEETIKDRFVAIPASDRDYFAEIGYLNHDKNWLSISRSNIVRVFSRPYQEFWFEADAELIIHGATEPDSTVTIGGQPIKLKQDGTFHLRIPFTEELIDYVMTAVAKNGEKAKTIHMHFEQNGEDRG